MSKRKAPISHNINVANAKATHTISVDPTKESPFYTESFFKRYWLPSIILVILSFGIYYACLPYDYVLDDKIVASENQYVKEGFSGIKKILTTESFQGYFGEKKNLVQGNRYRPLSIVTFAMEYGILGKLNPTVSHFINILLYGLTGIILMLVLSMLFRNYKTDSWWFSIPFIAAILYIAHPIHTEAVANIKGRDEIMTMLFSLLTLYGSMRYIDTGKISWIVGTVVYYFLALLSKENAITFLAVIPLSIYFFSETNWPKLKNLMIWIIVATILYLILRNSTAGPVNFAKESKDLMNNPFLGMTSVEKMGSIMYSLGKYIALFVWPHPLSHDYYPYAIPKISIIALIPLLSLVAYVSLGYFGIKGISKKSVYAYSILFYLATLSIVSNIFINVGTFMNERFVFMASAGFSIATAYFLVAHLPKLNKYGRQIALVLAGVMLVGYSAKSYVRVPVWKDALSLNGAAVAISSNSARANSFMATAFFDKYKETLMPNAVKRLSDEQRNLLNWTEVYAKKAIDIVPDYSNANLMLIGVVTERYKTSGDIKQYVTDMKPCIIRRPDIPFIKEFSDYLKGKNEHQEELFGLYLSVGQELMNVKDERSTWALNYLNYAYEIHPNNKVVNQALATVYERLGNTNQAKRFQDAANALQ